MTASAPRARGGSLTGRPHARIPFRPAPARKSTRGSKASRRGSPRRRGRGSRRRPGALDHAANLMLSHDERAEDRAGRRRPAHHDREGRAQERLRRRPDRRATGFVRRRRGRAGRRARGRRPQLLPGADVEWQRASIDLSYYENVEDAMRLYRMLETIDECPAPVVARVQGLRARRRLRARSVRRRRRGGTRRGLRVHRGPHGHRAAVISPSCSPASQRRCPALLLTGERFGAETALRIGLVHEVMDELDAAVEQVVGQFIAAGPEAARAAKRLVRDRPVGERPQSWPPVCGRARGAGGPPRVPREARGDPPGRRLVGGFLRAGTSLARPAPASPGARAPGEKDDQGDERHERKHDRGHNTPSQSPSSHARNPTPHRGTRSGAPTASSC